MKATKSILVLGALATTLFTACTKSEYITPDGQNMTTQNAREADGSNMKLTFKTASMSFSTIHVKSGEKYLADLGGTHTWNMFSPLSTSGLKLAAGSYENLLTTIYLTPMNGAASLHLLGDLSMITGGDQMTGRRVDFAINSPMTVKANSGAINLSESTNMLELLNLRLDRLGENISSELWMRAVNESSYAITVSPESNPEIYQIMLKNLGAMLQTSSTPTENTTSPNPMTPDQARIPTRYSEIRMMR
jgi:hypothetical protein